LKVRFLIPSQKTHAFISAKGMLTMALKQRQFGPLMAIASEAFFDMSMITNMMKLMSKNASEAKLFTPFLKIASVTC